MQYQQAEQQIQDIASRITAILAVQGQPQDGGVATVRRFGNGQVLLVGRTPNGRLTVATPVEILFTVTHDGQLKRYHDAKLWQIFIEDWAKEVAPQKAEKKRRAVSQRCPFHGAIRRFFAAAKQRSLDTNDEVIRLALSQYFNRAIETRKQLSGRDWAEAAEAVARHQLVW